LTGSALFRLMLSGFVGSHGQYVQVGKVTRLRLPERIELLDGLIIQTPGELTHSE
jgi:hypothetical protein